ncbi:CDP-diacylglycerol--glycerol-3-phosphate 3-phosphatidyltransferase [Paraferrimonas haliotis]|uniref:CDP-diacylglycerol--glycerol-3-phosphate 3-phosphatidyltransferase n=1 Tax=Paraferrimonas haliotis TaxID=2013866 RepID=A0AA37TU58_9GAMM|nr:CDP-diacylglycerol--glycerol-3-phosphate 3-phosphatidyltransferase [Paraferrimonas haliotis]GLS84537.1 CDP-diacylglycerol--glycerol-3-phosphate 3-phosphatidyltransferase [Paraferrimonas haliotis]
MILNIPIALTLFRFILIPVFVGVFYLPFESAYFAAALIFVLASFTDYLDGYLARRLNQSTEFGAFLDPVADKVMVATALVLLVDHYSVWWITLPALIMICREIVISALREWMAELGKRGRVAVSRLGKYKTAVQMVAITGLIWQHNSLIINLAVLCLYAATILTLTSMWVYIAAAWKDLIRK